MREKGKRGFETGGCALAGADAWLAEARTFDDDNVPLVVTSKRQAASQ